MIILFYRSKYSYTVSYNILFQWIQLENLLYFLCINDLQYNIVNIYSARKSKPSKHPFVHSFIYIFLYISCILLVTKIPILYKIVKCFQHSFLKYEPTLDSKVLHGPNLLLLFFFGFQTFKFKCSKFRTSMDNKDSEKPNILWGKGHVLT